MRVQSVQVLVVNTLCRARARHVGSEPNNQVIHTILSHGGTHQNHQIENVVYVSPEVRIDTQRPNLQSVGEQGMGRV